MGISPLLIVFVVPAHPKWPAAILIAALGYHIQIVIMDVEYLIPTHCCPRQPRIDLLDKISPLF